MHLFSTWVSALFLHHGLSSALQHSKLRQNQDAANRGLYPDGTPIQGLQQRQTKLAKQQPPGPIPAEYIQLPLDHWNADAGTYQNRYWVSDANYKPGGPVFVYDGGEGDASGSVSVLNSPDSIMGQFMKQYHGIGIVWEHRYYGTSTPVKIDLNTPASAFEYLDTEQALADVPAFAWNFTRKNFPDVDLTPGSTPWVFVGGSYPGIRAAFVRHTYPETIFASYAASAPVEASIDMSFYFEPAWKGMIAYGYGNCTADIQAAVRAMDDIMDAGGNQSFALKEKFLGSGTGNNTNSGFADALTTIFANWQSYGASYGIGSFCDYISTDPVTKKTSDASGWAAVKGVQFTIDRWASWPNWISTVNEGMNTQCAGPNNGKSTSCNLSARSSLPDSISWGWQYCTQWGFFQSVNTGDHQLVSKYNSLEHQREVCHNQFPDGSASGLLPDWPKANETNERYGGWDIRPSNTYWTAGKYDPWRTLSPLSDMEFSPHNVAVETVPTCASSDATADSPLFGYLMDNAEHCFDFRDSFPGSVPARKLFDQALDKWLTCFKPTGHNGTTVQAKYQVNTGIRRVSYP
jgi:hypothetical protein